jgi:hypothetical protein
MADGDIFELNIDQTYNGQQMTNVLHFKQDGTDGSGSVLVALGNVWVVNMQSLHLALLVSSLNVDQLRIRKLFPTQTQQFLQAVNLPGDALGDGLPPQQCAILSQQATRGGPGGRRGNGHMKVSGVPITAQDSGRINNAYGADMVALGAQFQAKLTDIPTGFTFDSVVLSMVDDVARVIVGSGPTSRIRTVYSRSIGVGQ